MPSTSACTTCGGSACGPGVATMVSGAGEEHAGAAPRAKATASSPAVRAYLPVIWGLLRLIGRSAAGRVQPLLHRLLVGVGAHLLCLHGQGPVHALLVRHLLVPQGQQRQRAERQHCCDRHSEHQEYRGERGHPDLAVGDQCPYPQVHRHRSGDRGQQLPGDRPAHRQHRHQQGRTELQHAAAGGRGLLRGGWVRPLPRFAWPTTVRIYGAAQVVAVRVLPAALRAAVPVCCWAVPTVTVAAVPVGSLAAVPVLASVPLLAFVPVLRPGPPTRRRWRRRVRRGVRVAHETPCGRGLDPFSQMAGAALRSLAVKPKRIVVLISGGGSNLAALLRAAAEADYGAQIVAVGADRPSAAGLQLAADAGVPTFVCRLQDYPERSDWDAALTAEVVAHEPDLVISAGFLKLVGPQFLAAFGG